MPHRVEYGSGIGGERDRSRSWLAPAEAAIFAHADVRATKGVGGCCEKTTRELRKSTYCFTGQEGPVDHAVAYEEEALGGADRHGKMVDGSGAEPGSSHIGHGESMYPMRLLALAYSNVAPRRGRLVFGRWIPSSRGPW